MFSSKLDQEAYLIFYFSDFLPILNDGRRRKYELDEVAAAAQKFEQLHLGSLTIGEQPKQTELDQYLFQISPRGLNLGHNLLDRDQSTFFDRASGWRWWMPIAGMTGLLGLALASYNLVTNAQTY